MTLSQAPLDSGTKLVNSRTSVSALASSRPFQALYRTRLCGRASEYPAFFQPSNLLAEEHSYTVIPFTNIPMEAYQNWLANGKQVDTKNGYPAVILLPDDTVVKFWAKKTKLFSSARLSPYSNRFVRNAIALNKLNIPAPKIISHGRLENTKVRLVHYHSIPGECIRSILHNNPQNLDIPALARFYKSLHDLGINFKGGHLGNIIQIDPERFGLIDFTSLKIHSRPLNSKERLRNLARPLSYKNDLRAMKEAGLPDLLKSYSALA